MASVPNANQTNENEKNYEKNITHQSQRDKYQRMWMVFVKLYAQWLFGRAQTQITKARFCLVRNVVIHRFLARVLCV